MVGASQPLQSSPPRQRQLAAGDWLLRRGGFSLNGASIILIRLTDCEAQYDPYDWANRTMQTAHVWLLERFEQIESGAVVDVEHILGETPAPKVSERFERSAGAIKEPWASSVQE